MGPCSLLSMALHGSKYGASITTLNRFIWFHISDCVVHKKLVYNKRHVYLSNGDENRLLHQREKWKSFFSFNKSTHTDNLKQLKSKDQRVFHQCNWLVIILSFTSAACWIVMWPSICTVCTCTCSQSSQWAESNNLYTARETGEDVLF